MFEPNWNMGIGEDIQGELSEEMLATAVGNAWRLAAAELLDSVVQVSEEIQRLEALRVKLVGAVDHRCKVDVLGFPNAKMWLTSKTLYSFRPGRSTGNGSRSLPTTVPGSEHTDYGPQHDADR